MGHVLGIDVSTTATKAVLVDEAGAVVGVGVTEYGYDTPHPSWSEQDPALWWDGAIGAIVIHNPADTDNEVDIRLPDKDQDSTHTALDPAFLPGGSPNGSPVAASTVSW